MFLLTQGAGTNSAFPDVCNTPAGPAVVPVPYPNIAMTATTAPAAYNVITDCMPSLNQMSQGLVSVGDQPGVLLGVADGCIAGGTTYIVGCVTILVGGAPAQRLTSVTGQNAIGKLPNTVGASVAPSQVTVLTLG